MRKLLKMLIKVYNDIPCASAILKQQRAKIIPTVLALQTTKYLDKETEYIPWKSAVNNLDYFYLMFDRSEVYGPMQVSNLSSTAHKKKHSQY